MSPWSRLRAVALALVSVSCGSSSCASSPPHLGPAWAFSALGTDSARQELVGVDELELPAQGEVHLLPRWVQLAPRSGPGAGTDAGGAPQRLQVVVRAVRADGGVWQWLVGGQRDAPAGEGARRLDVESGTRLELGGARLGPMSVGSLVALEVIVSTLPDPPARQARWVGGAALTRAPQIGEAGPAERRAADAVVAADGAVLVLAARLALRSAGQDSAPGTYTKRVVLVTATIDAPLEPGRVGALEPAADGPILRDLDGLPMGAEAAVVLDVVVEVPDHGEP